MRPNLGTCSHVWLRACILALVLTPSHVAAQTDIPAEDPPTSVQVTLAGYTLELELTDTGEPVLDEDGEPVILLVPLDESVVTPGDQVLYVITLDNPTEDTAMNLQLGAQVAAELVLDPFSFAAPEGLAIEWADEDSPDLFRPIFEEIDDEQVMTADLDALRALRLTLTGDDVTFVGTAPTIDAEFNATATALTRLKVTAPQLSASKSVVVLSEQLPGNTISCADGVENPTANLAPIPGACVEYTIEVTNAADASSSATNVAISDTVSDNLSISPSIRRSLAHAQCSRMKTGA